MSYAGHIPQEGKGALFQNEKKSAKAPDWSGSILHEGKTIKIAGWVKNTSSGKQLISLIVDTWVASKDAKRPYTKEVTNDDDVPF